MTLAQLQSFVLVARHGSVKAAAAELEVTEPAVSVAVAALRKELGDELFVRSGRGIALTPGGRRLAALAGEILGARRAGAPLRGRVAGRPRAGSRSSATSLVAEHISPLIEMFAALDEGARDRGRVRARRRVRGPARAPARGHRARPAPRSRAGDDDRLGAVPALPADHRRRARRTRSRAARAIAPAALAGERWLIGQPDLDPSTATGLFFARNGLDPAELGTYSSHAAAIAAAAAGEGLVLTLGPLGRRGGPPARAGPARRARHPERRGVAREHARPRPRAAGRAGAAALRHDGATPPRRSRPDAPARSPPTRARRCT